MALGQPGEGAMEPRLRHGRQAVDPGTDRYRLFYGPARWPAADPHRVSKEKRQGDGLLFLQRRINAASLIG